MPSDSQLDPMDSLNVRLDFVNTSRLFKPIKWGDGKDRIWYPPGSRENFPNKYAHVTNLTKLRDEGAMLISAPPGLHDQLSAMIQKMMQTEQAVHLWRRKRKQKMKNAPPTIVPTPAPTRLPTLGMNMKSFDAHLHVDDDVSGLLDDDKKQKLAV